MRRVLVAVAGLAAALLGAGTPARAEWLRASSAHFVIYSDTGEQQLRRQATDLELFDALVRRFHNLRENPDAAFNKVTLYVVRDPAAIQKLGAGRNVYGFYIPRVAGSVAFTPRVAGTIAQTDFARIVLYHEYAHHLLLSNYAFAYPAWFSEGYAEFVSTMMKKDGRYWIGAAANHRAYDLVLGARMPAHQLFAPPQRMNGAQQAAIYSRGWLLTHYIMFDPAHRRQFDAFLTAFNAGKPPVAAATEAFGDLKALDAALDRYLRQPRLLALSVAPEALGTPAIDVRPLSRGERALIELRIRSERGVDPETGARVFATAAPLAAAYRVDAVAQGWLAEMAFDAGDDDAAEAAADAALAIDPRSSQALRYKAMTLLRRAKAAGTDGPWTEARRWIVKANRVEPNDAEALVLFYDSFEQQGVAPSRNATMGLERAVVLVPQDPSLRFRLARQYVIDGEPAAAQGLLRALAYEPHGDAETPAAKLLEILESGQHGRAAIDALEQAAKQAAAAEKK